MIYDEENWLIMTLWSRDHVKSRDKLKKLYHHQIWPVVNLLWEELTYGVTGSSDNMFIYLFIYLNPYLPLVYKSSRS